MSGPRFVDWRRPDVMAGLTPQPGRPPRLRLGLTARDSTGATTHGSVDAVFRWPPDIARLTAAAIRHRAPAPGSQDAETTKLAHVDLRSPDLPWRYSPHAATPGTAGLPPWLALVVAARHELTLDAGGLALSPATQEVLKQHPPARLTLAAHVQVPEGERAEDAGTPSGARFSRILCVRALAPDTDYTAMLVPTIGPRGGPMWDAAGVVDNDGRPVPVFDSWSFRTGEGGDFETLAAALWMPDPGDVGRATLRYRPPAGDAVAIEVRGALSSLKDVVPVLDADLAAVTDDLRALTTTPVGDGGPELIGMPEYGMPWVDAPADVGPGWGDGLRRDPRDRVHAGTGTRLGVTAQDELMRAAVEQIGALREASVRIAQLAAGLDLAGRVFGRALPGDAADRVRVLGPMATRLVADDGSLVVDTVGGAGSTLTPEIFSSAGQRMLHRGARGARGAVTSGDLLRLVDEVDEPVPPEPGSEAAAAADLDDERWYRAGIDPDQRERLRGFLDAAWRALAEAGAEYRRRRDDDERWAVAEEATARLEGLLEEWLPEVAERCGTLDLLLGQRDLLSLAALLTGGASLYRPPGEDTDSWLARLRRARASFAVQLMGDEAEIAGVYGVLQTLVIRCLAHCETLSPESEDDGCSDRVAGLGLPAPDPRRPVDIDVFSGGLDGVLDPRGSDPPGRRRLKPRLVGLDLDTLAPPRYPLGLDFPTWSLLARHEPDWLLPGASSLLPDSITALRTNPAFIDAYLVGLNGQFLAETRWRGIATDPWGTPLRMFFAPVDPVTRRRSRDVIPIQDWTTASPLGARQHQATRATHQVEADHDGARLAIILHTALFRRYPSTVVYLHRGGPSVSDASLAQRPQLDLGLDLVDDEELVALAMTSRVDIPPSFTGSLSPDLVFFGFDVVPEELDDYWLMLDEPPAELRFRSDLAGTATGSAAFAASIVDTPTRVAISGATLKEWSSRQAGGIR